MRTETEQKEFLARVEKIRSENRTYYPVESRVMDGRPGDFAYFHALDEARQAFVVQSESLNVDLVLRVYTDDRLLTCEEFEQMYVEAAE